MEHTSNTRVFLFFVFFKQSVSTSPPENIIYPHGTLGCSAWDGWPSSPQLTDIHLEINGNIWSHMGEYYTIQRLVWQNVPGRFRCSTYNGSLRRNFSRIIRCRGKNTAGNWISRNVLPINTKRKKLCLSKVKSSLIRRLDSKSQPSSLKKKIFSYFIFLRFLLSEFCHAKCPPFEVCSRGPS